MITVNKLLKKLEFVDEIIIEIDSKDFKEQHRVQIVLFEAGVKWNSRKSEIKTEPPKRFSIYGDRD